MNFNGLKPSDATLAWLQSSEGMLALTERTRDSIRVLSEVGLPERLQGELKGLKAGGTKVFRSGNSFRGLSAELTILVLAHQFGVKISPKTWEMARAVGALMLGMDNLSFQGQMAKPPQRADLWTADIGVHVAVAAQFASPLGWDKGEVDRFLEAQCLSPIRAEWLDDATRIHSLDSMGHNWWAVLVAGAGIVETLAGRNKNALEIAARLEQWFSYPGNAFSRKTRSFGAEGDFLEGFGYGEYALLNPCILAFLLQEHSVNLAWLEPRQWEGLAAWYKKAFVRNSEGTWWPERFGDIHLSYRIRAEVWHTLSRLAEDGELLAMAHQLKPRPHGVFEFLMWEPLPQAASYKAKPTCVERPMIYPTSGLAFLGGDRVSLAVRAGEFWNHNHQDAGSFIFHQDGVVWMDDCGTCAYSLPEYVEYYTTPRAHNVAYAPDLAPPNPRLAAYEGMHLPGRFLFHGRAPGVEVLATDTQVLSGGGLAQSHRVFIALDNAIAVIWDNLQGYHPESFDFLLHTTCVIKLSNNEPAALESGEGKLCPLSFFSENPARYSAEAAAMGELSKPDAYSHGDPLGSLQGQCMKWHGDKALRQKFGLAMGTALRSAQWRIIDSGWEVLLETGAARWSIWFNRNADGRTMHQSPIATWQGIETDAYALLVREEGDTKNLYGIQSSFLRRDGAVIQGSSRKSIITRVAL